MKQVRVGPGRLNEALLDFANHHGFTPRTHRPYRPRTKGKVERAVDYVKDNFLLGRTFADLDDLNAQGIAWMEGTANVRVHATTGRRPVELLAAEGLTPNSCVPAYRYHEPARRVANAEAMVHFRGSRYSVPPTFAGRPVEVLSSSGMIMIRSANVIVAEHREATEPGQCVADRGHLAALWKATDEQVRRPAREQPALIDATRVQRVDLRIYEEVVS